MKINFDNDYINPNSINNHSNDNASKSAATKNVSAGKDIFKITFGDSEKGIGAYSKKKTIEDVQAGLAATDVKAKRDYMSVMSLSMSNEDYAKMVSTGQVPEDMDAGDSVTIMDNIKAAIIKGGTQVNGYTDDIDAETLEAITGSVVAAGELISSMQMQDVPVNEENLESAVEAISMAMSSLPLSDGAAQYLIENDLEPTVQNIYQASHSGQTRAGAGASYYSQNGYITAVSDEKNLDTIMPQIEEIIEKSGLEKNETTLSEAKWLINKGIELTPQNLLKLVGLSELREGVTNKEITESVAIAMSAGIPARNSNLTYEQSIYISAEELIDQVNSISDEAIYEVADSGKEINIKNLISSQGKEIENEAILLHNRRLLEEVRLSMTVEANRLLLKSNFQIDIAPIEELVDALKAAEKTIADSLFRETDSEVSIQKYEIYKQVNFELSEIPSLPVDIIGLTDANSDLAFANDKPFTLHEVHEAGVSQREQYVKANERYETIMTAPRADMGDSIKKAFRNVDDILEDLNFEINEENQRAVRILGYNAMEITPENIEQIKEADTNLRNTISRLTPSRVLHMIRENVNPLNMPISELNEYMDNDDSNPEKQAENYARFLMQLEKHDEITELERESYIGIYRMLNSLDKSDDAAIGRLIQIGAETTFANLLSAMRSSAKAYMDYKVDDNFSGVDISRLNSAIDDQINAAFEIERFEVGSSVSEAAIENLLNMGEPVSLNNIDALETLKHKRGDWFKPISKLSDSVNSKEALIDSVIDDMTDSESAEDAYNAMLMDMENTLSEEIYKQDNYIDVRAIQSSMRQISILKHMAQDEEYDIPISIDGEITSIRLQIRHDKGAGELAVTMDTEALGKVAAQFSLSGTASGYIAFEKEKSQQAIMNVAEKMADEIGFTPDTVFAPDLNLDRFSEKVSNQIKKDSDSADINNTELYRIARRFISVLKNINL